MSIKELIKSLGIEDDKAKKLEEAVSKQEKELSEAKESNLKLKEAKDKAEKEAKESSEKLNIVAKSLKLDIDAEDLDKAIDDVKDSFSNVDVKVTEDYKELSRELTRTTRELEKSKKQLEEANATIEAEKTARTNATKNTAILEALTENKVIKADQWVSRFFGEVTIDEANGNLYMKDSSGKEISLKDSIAEWAKENPEFVKADVKGGAGTLGGGTQGGTQPNGGNEVSDFMKSIIESQNKPAGDGKSLEDLFG